MKGYFTGLQMPGVQEILSLIGKMMYSMDFIFMIPKEG